MADNLILGLPLPSEQGKKSWKETIRLEIIESEQTLVMEIPVYAQGREATPRGAYRTEWALWSLLLPVALGFSVLHVSLGFLPYGVPGEASFRDGQVAKLCLSADLGSHPSYCHLR